MKKRSNKSKLHKRIISIVLTLAIIFTSVSFPEDWRFPVISDIINATTGTVKAAETCPYSDSELDAGGFVQGGAFNQINTVEKLSLFSWWYREKADASLVTNAEIGINDFASFGGYSVISLNDNFTSIGTEAKPFYGNVKISTGSASCFFSKKPLFGCIEQASKIVDENNADKRIAFMRTVGYNTGDKPLFDSLNVLAEKIVNTKSTASSSPFKAECELVTVNSDTHYSNFSHQNTCGLVGNIGTGTYAELSILYNSPDISVTGSDNTGLFCDEMEANSHLAVEILNTSAVSYSITSSSENAGGVVGKMKSGSILVVPTGSNFNNVSQTITAGKYAGGLVGYSEDAYIGSSEPASATPYTLAIGDSIKTAGTTLVGTSGNGYVSGYYKNTVGNRVFSLSGLNVSSNIFTTAKSNAGGLFGVLCHEPDTTTEGFAGSGITINGGSGVSSSATGTCRMMVNATETSSGGLIGKYSTNDLKNTFTITDVYAKFSGDKDNSVGGMIGSVDDTSSAAYIVFSNVNAERSSGTKGGGLIGSAGSTNAKGVFVDVQNYIKIKNDFGAGLVHSIPRGVVRISGTTDLTGFTTGNMIVNSRDTALIYSRGTGDNTTWTLKRPTASISKDDIGTWGEVLRLTATGLTGNDIIDESNLSTLHKVTLAPVVVTAADAANDIPAYVGVSSLADFAKLALNIQHNTGSSTSAALTVSGSSTATLLATNITLSGDVDLRGTGIVGLTRDGDSMTVGEITDTVDNFPYKATFDGGDHTVTLAIGESYGNNPVSEGNGKIYEHRWSGLFASISGATIKDLTVTGICNKKPNNGDKLNSDLGGVSATASGNSNIVFSKVTSSITCNIDKGSIKNSFIGGIIGRVYSSTAGILSFSGCSSSAVMNDNTEGTNCHMGGYIGYIDSSANALTVNFNAASSTSCSLGGSYTNFGHAKDYTVYGGLIGAVRGTEAHAVKTTININDLKVDGLTITSATKTTDSDTEGSAGILGYAWVDADVNINKLNIGSTPPVSSTVTGGKNAAGLVYCATGHWKVKRIDNYNASITTETGGRLGLLVTRGINEAKVSAIGDKAHDAASALYLEILDKSTNAANSEKNFAIGNARVSNATGVFDEIVAFTHKNGGDITANSQNAVVSINTDGSGTGVIMTGSACNTYQNKTTFGNGKVNAHSRYYYNLDTILAKESKTDAETFLLWSVKTYANPKIESKFGSSFSLGSNASLDMNGLSYYTIDYAAFSDLNKIGTVKFYNKQIEVGESATGNSDSAARSTTNTTSQSQHYMMHCGLFRNAVGSISIGSLTLQGNVGKYDGNCGFIISGVLGGSDTTASSFSDTALTLDGATINTSVTAGSYAPLIINNVEKNTTLNVKTVRSSGYTTLTSGAGYAASSLIGKVGKEDETDTGMNLTFSDIALDARKTVSSVSDVTQKGLFDSVYGSNRTIFSNATLLHHYFYSGTSSTGTYNYTHDADWGTSGTAVSAAPHLVTYGQEIVNTVDHIDSTTSASEQNKYYGSEKFTSPSNNNLTSSEYSEFSTDFVPYVYDIGTLGSETGSNSDNKHELRVNIAVTNLNEGCGTYNDPYVLKTSKQFETLATLINSPGTFAATDFVINLPSDGITGNLQWCDNCEQEEGETTALDHKEFSLGTGSDSEKFVNGSTKYTKTAVSEYLAGAYYLIDATTVTLGNAHTLGTGANAFHGVIVGKNQIGDVYPTVNLSTALVDNSDGCVIKNLNFARDQFNVAAQAGKAEFSYGTGCAVYGGIINKIMGGDNIIDNVGITFADAPYTEATGTYNHTIPIGGYVGVVFNGGLFFRNMDSVTNKAGLPASAAKYLYRNPIIGRVLNGYAVCEDCTALNNGDKNYYITRINSAAKDKLTITSSAITAKSAQAWFVLSLLVNSGTMQKTESGSTTNLGLYIGSNHKSAHRGTYNDVGCKNTKTSGASGTVCDNSLFTSGIAEKGNVKPYLMTNYTTDGAETPSSGVWLNTSTGYDITMNDDEMDAEDKVWTLDKAYRGIGGFNAYDSGESNFSASTNTVDGSIGKNCNSTCNIKVKSLTANSTEIVLDMQFKSYRHFEAKNENKAQFVASLDNYTTLDSGFGLFNTFIASQALTITGLTVSGSVFSDYYSEDDGEIYSNYGGVALWPRKYGATISQSKRLSCGLFAGRKNDSNQLNLKNCTINIETSGDGIHSGKNCGGFIGSAKAVSLQTCTAQNVKIFGRFDTGGLLGYADGCTITGKITGSEAKSTVTIDSIIQQMRGTNLNEDNKRYTGCGGLVGRTAGSMTIDYISVTKAAGKTGLISYDNRMIKAGKVVGSDDSTYMGGIVGCGNSGSTITIDNCEVNALSIDARCEAAGAVAGGGVNTYIITNVDIDGKGTATINSCGKEPIGGIIGYVRKESTIENVRLYNYSLHKDLPENMTTIQSDYYSKTGDNYYQTSQNSIGIAIGGTLTKVNIKNLFVSDCTVSGECCKKVGGICGYNKSQEIVGYNIAIKNITSNMVNTNSYSNTSYAGDLVGTGGVGNLKIVGFYRNDTPTDKMIAGAAFTTAANSTTKYIIFSDYTGVGIPDPKNADDDLKVGSGNQPKVNGSNVVMSGALNSPFATSNPGLEMQGGDLYTGDGAASTVTGLPVQSIITDMDATTDIPKNKYTVTTSETNLKKYYPSCFSTFKTEWSDSGLPDDFKDFVVMLVEDPSRDNTTEMINSYLQLLTNTNYEVSNYGYSGVYTFSIQKVQYNSEFGNFTYSNNANLKNQTSSTASDRQFYMGTDADTDESVPTFTLLDVAFKDPTDSNKYALHLYIPIIVKKMIDVDFELATGSGTPFDSQWYVDNHRYDTGKILAENIGSTGTLCFTYTYKRTQKEWKEAMEAGDNFLLNYDKALTLTPANQSANLTDFPNATQLVLVDANPGRLGKEYYSTIGTAYNSTTKKLSLSGESNFFTNGTGESTEVFKPVPLSDLLNITAVADSTNGKFVIDNDNPTVEAALNGTKTKFRLATSSDSGQKYKLTVVNVAGNSTQAGSNENIHPKERYYLTFYTDRDNEPSEAVDSAIHYYTVTADKLTASSGASKAKYNTRDDKSIIFANLFEQTNVTYYTYKNRDLPQLAPEEINDTNDSVFVHLESQIGFTSQASNTFGAQLSTVDMYQSFMVYMTNTETNKIGIYGNPAVSANIKVKSVGGNVDESTYSASTNARTVLNYAEVLTNNSISSYLNDGGAIIEADLVLSYPNLGQRTSQFASRSGNNTTEDRNKYTTVSAYSKIGFDKDTVALSKNQETASLKTGSDDYQNYRYYIISRKDPSLDYYAYASDDGRQFGQLGINANDLPDNTGKVTIETAAEFDVRPISSLVANCGTVKITFTLQQKKQYSDGTFNYTVYEPLDTGRSITDYLYNVHVNLTGASTPVLDSATNTYTFTVPRSSVIALDNKDASQSDFMKIPIVFDVFTGSDTPKNADGSAIEGASSFESKNLRYANYKVVVTAQMMDGNTAVGASPSDDLVYTNAKLLVDYIKPE